MASIQRRAYTVREFADMYGKSTSWAKREVESGRIEARFPTWEDAGQDDPCERDCSLGEGVVECRSWRTYDDSPLTLGERIDPDSVLGHVVIVAEYILGIGILSGIIPAILMALLGVQ